MVEKRKGKNVLWNQDLIRKLFELYEENVCLYDTKNVFYSNEHARADALCKIHIALSELNNNITVEDIKSKINNIRSQLSHELQKIKESKRSGAGTDEIYEPSIWWFECAQFLLPYMHPKKGKDSLMEETQETEQEESNISQSESFTETEDTSILEATPSSSSLPPAAKKVKRNNNEPVEIQTEIHKTLQTLNNNLTEKSNLREQEFGNLVAKDLSEIDDIEVSLDVKHEINNIIYDYKKKWVEKKRDTIYDVTDTLNIL